MRHFVVVYDRRRRELVEGPDEFSRAEEARQARWERDMQYRDDPEVEVVVLSANSADALRTTHARFFKTVAQLAS